MARLRCLVAPFPSVKVTITDMSLLKSWMLYPPKEKGLKTLNRAATEISRLEQLVGEEVYTVYIGSFARYLENKGYFFSRTESDTKMSGLIAKRLRPTKVRNPEPF